MRRTTCRHCPANPTRSSRRRDAIGGTWDLFRYPGIRSDSDMYTLGYSFRPGRSKAIADGASIRAYIRRDGRRATASTARSAFSHRVTSASWSSEDARWTLDVETRPGANWSRFTCNFLFGCAGYYATRGLHARIPGVERFRGRVVHPQHWPRDLDYAGKRVVVIGSGATAVTLVPELAKTAAHVTMLQRSPSYIVSRAVAKMRSPNALRALSADASSPTPRALEERAAAGSSSTGSRRRKPDDVKRWIARAGRATQLGPGYDVETHFTPRYNPWDQRLCLVPDGDLFRAIRDGTASVVTDHIETFTETRHRARSRARARRRHRRHRDRLELQVLGGVAAHRRRQAGRFGRTMNYKGMMFSDVPNFAGVLRLHQRVVDAEGDLTCALRLPPAQLHGPARLCAVHAARGAIRGLRAAVRRLLLRLHPALHRQVAASGRSKPWKLYQNYVLDLLTLRYGALDDGALEFARRARRARPRKHRARSPLGRQCPSKAISVRTGTPSFLIFSAPPRSGRSMTKQAATMSAPDLLQQLHRRLGRAAGGDQIVDQDDLLAGRSPHPRASPSRRCRIRGE